VFVREDWKLSREMGRWLPILQYMGTDWAQEIVKLGKEVSLASFSFPLKISSLKM